MLTEVVRRESLERHRLVFAGLRLRVLTLLQPLFSDCGLSWSLSEEHRKAGVPQQGQTGEEPSEEGFSELLWREAGVGANPSSTSYQRHGIGAITDSSGTGLTINTC